MKITHRNSPKAGITEHVRPDVGRVLVASGLAEEVPFPPRGSKGWLAAIQEQDALRTGPSAYDTPAANATGVQWSATVMGSGLVSIVKKVDGQTFWFDAPPADCPKNIREQFVQLANLNPGANAAALETAKRNQWDNDAKVQHAKRW